MKFSRGTVYRMMDGRLTHQIRPNTGTKKNRPRVKSKKSYPLHIEGRDGRAEPSVGRFYVKSVLCLPFSQITAEQAQGAGFADRWALRQAMEVKLGGKFGDEKSFWVIEWEIIQREGAEAA